MLQKMLRMSDLLDVYGVLLTEKQREMCVEYYLNDLSLGEIAETHGVTRQAVHDTLLRAQRAMEGYEAHFGLMAKQAEQLASLTSLRAQLVEAREFIAKGDVKSADAAVEAAERILGDLLTDSAPGAQEDVQPVGPQMNTNTDERRVSAGV
jgi:predicted DNA-binding protein YlxM (UPF0122 family)